MGWHMARLHRWFAFAVGAMLPVWFATGMVLSFQPFPSLSQAAKFAAAEPVRLEPGTAFQPFALPASAASPRRIRLVSIDGSDRFLVQQSDGHTQPFDVRTGRALAPIDTATAGRIAAAFAGVAVLAVEGPIEQDRWTVHDKYLLHRPLFRVRLADDAGTVLYLSAATGEVLQQTTARQRGWNQVGALLHWLNLGNLRAHFEAWHFTIRSVATLALVLTLSGLTIGVLRARQARRLARQRFSPFRGLQRLHHLLGLLAGFVILWWLVSGWLSLDQGTLFSSDQPTPPQRQALQGLDLLSAAAAFGQLDELRLGPAVELEFSALAGRPLLIVRGAGAGDSHLLMVDAQGEVQRIGQLGDADLRSAVNAAMAPQRVREVVPIAADDGWARRDSPFSATTRRFVMDDAARTWVHIEARSGEIVSLMDASRRRYRWIVDGLHTMDFPPLNRAGDAWHVLLLCATTLGLVFTATGVVLGWRRLRKSRY
jgi:hypothetical protein